MVLQIFPFSPDNTSRKMQFLPRATQVAGVVDDSVIILVIHRHLYVEGVRPEMKDILTVQNARDMMLGDEYASSRWRTAVLLNTH